MPSNQSNNRPSGSPNIPRPGPAQSQVPQAPVVQGGHPLVRPAPPVQENAQHQQNEQAKFNAWQQQRESSAPHPTEARSQPQARPPQPPAHGEAPHK